MNDGKTIFTAIALLLSAFATSANADMVDKTSKSDIIPPGSQHDFDWEFGTWKTDLRRLKHPLSGKSEWLHYSGTTAVRPIWGGKANMVELMVEGPAGRLEALSLRLRDPETGVWSLNYANSSSGDVSQPSPKGHFRGTRGEFYDREPFNGQQVNVRFVITVLSRNCAHFEQSFSKDGKDWEVNWIAIDTRAGTSEQTCKMLLSKS